jgi:hypothetical protein
MTISIAHEIGLHRVTAAPDRTITVARRVALGRKVVEKSHIHQESPRRRRQRFADPRRRLGVALGQDDASRRRKVERSRRACRAGAQDQDVGVE